MSPLILEKTVAAAIWGAAGTGIFFFLVNRWVLALKDHEFKLPLMLAIFAVVVAGTTAYGWHCGWAPPLRAPLAVLALGLLGEIRRLARRRRLRGPPPLAHRNLAAALHHPLSTTALAVVRYAVPLPPAWRGGRLRIALLSDLHLSGHLPLSYYEEAMAVVTAEQPDLIFLTGDFVGAPEFADRLPGLLGGLRSRCGTFAILGNHDYWTDGPRVAAALRQAGVDVIGNGVRRLACAAAHGAPQLVRLTGADAVPAGPAAARLALWGCEDPWGTDRWQPPGPPPADGGRELVLVLSHTADNIYRLSAAGAFAVFAGHYHAGQMQLPWVGPLILPSRFGRLFTHGHFLVGGTHLFVTAGLGITSLPFRLYCQPDIFIVDFEKACSAERLPQ